MEKFLSKIKSFSFREVILAKSPTTYEKGLALELKLADLFKKSGYDVVHDAKRLGRSGVEHQIDVLAEYRCPLHISRVVVEAKSYDSPIDKDKIMKLIQIVDDLGADHGIIVTTSYFTPEAIKTAQGNNVELWNRDRLVKLLGEVELTAAEKGLPEKVYPSERAAQPRLSIKDAEAIIKSILDERARGGFLGKGKIVERLDSIILQYYPYYEAEIQTAISEVEKTGLLSTRTVQKMVTARVNVNAMNGDIVTVDNDGISSPYPFLRILNEEEIKVFKSMKKKTWSDVHEVIGLGYSEGRARKILSGLTTKGVLETGQGRRGITIYRPRTLFPHDPRALRSISDVLRTQEISKIDVQFITPKIEASDVIKRIELYWNATVNKITLLYYPYFICNLTTQEGSQRMDMIDAINGKLIEI